MALPVAAQDESPRPKGAVEGVVRGPQGEPLPGASVLLVGTSQGDASDPDGRYRIEAPPGSYRLRVTFVGFRTQSIRVTLQAGTSITQDVTLQPGLLEMTETVTTATFNPFSKLESSVAITTLSARDVERDAPTSTADLLKSVPGLYVESSGGVTENNVFVRGLPADGSYRYVAIHQDGTPVFEPTELDFANPDAFVRVDATVDRVETVRGGTASTFASNAPGGIVNVVSQHGAPPWSGVVKGTVQPRGLVRGDVRLGGPLGDHWRIALGGFYRRDPGPRDPGFTGNRGGQVKASLTWLRSNATVRLFGTHLNDRTLFYLPVPYVDRRDPSSIPGFDIRTGTLTSDDLAVVDVPTPTLDGATTQRDLRNGVHPVLWTGGLEVLVDLGRGWSIHNTARLTDIDHTFRAIFSLENPIAAATYADSTVARANRQRGVSATGWRYRDTATGAIVDPNQLNGNGLVVQTGWWYNEKPLTNALNDLRIQKTMGRHALTAQVYLSRFTSDDFRHWHDVLTEVDERPDRLDLELLGANDDVVAHATQRGFRAFGTNYTRHEGTGTVAALHLADTWDVTDRLRIDASLRLQHAAFTGRVERRRVVNRDDDAASGAPNAPATLYDDAFQLGTGVFDDYDFAFDDWTLSGGFNYRFSDHTAVFARASRGVRLPNFDQWIASALAADLGTVPQIEQGTPEDVLQIEGGVKVDAPRFALFASGFYSRLDDIPFSEQVVGPGGGTVTVQNFGSSRTIGTELEAILRPSPHLDVAFRTTVQNPIFDELRFLDPQDGVLDFAGNRVKRIPLLLFRFTPTYRRGGLRVHGTWTYFGDRFANNRNTFTLPAFSVVDAGAAYTWHGVTLSVTARNVFGARGLTEGNPRIDETLSADEADAIDVFMGRPILPRSLQTRLAYRF